MPGAGEEEAAAALALKDLSTSLKLAPFSDLPALLRRCFCLLPYLDAGEKRLAHRCHGVLLRSLRRVLSAEHLPALEVFIQNLIFRDGLRGCLVQRDSAAQRTSPIFVVNPPFRGELHAVLELVCNHFISSLKDKGGFRAFCSALKWSGKQRQGAPEICFRGALRLINITSSFSLPGVVQAHLLLLASRCIDGPDLDSHVLAFECFMNLYVDCLPALGVFNKRDGVENVPGPLAQKRPLTCFIKEVTHQKLKNLVYALLSFCQVHVGDGLPISDSDFCAICDRLVKKNKHLLLQGKFRQEATLIMMSILSKVLQCAKEREVHELDAEMTQEIICLAAVLRVMGSLLLQVLNHFSQMRAADNITNANHVALHIYYSILCDTIRLLSHYEANELHRCDFFSNIGPVDRERASVQMLTHFASLLVFCLRRRLGFLLRVCIVMMLMAINLMILEEDSNDADKGKLTSTCAPDTNKVCAPHTNKGNRQIQDCVRRSTLEIASQFGALRNRSAGKTDGRTFLQCHPEHASNWDDFVDFFECEEGMDYSNYLNKREKFKSFKMVKYISSLRNKRKRQNTRRLKLW